MPDQNHHNDCHATQIIIISRVKHDGDNDDSNDNDDDDADEKEDLSHHEMIGHVVSGADVVRLSIHVNTWLLPDFNH